MKYLTDGNSAKAGQYPGSILQINAGSDPDVVDLYRLADQSTVRVAGVRTYTGGSYSPYMAMGWAEVGTQMVTAAGYDGNYNDVLLAVSRDGTVTQRPSPCGDDIGGVLPVPGAVLVACQRMQGATPVGFDIIALRSS